ncbi:MAG: hypothetical protein IAE67_11175 [Candidatus Competibacteraceae bacterium]|nr:hypothetical protein [Candidatus Competibacteraceae bacterium]
MIFVFSLPGNAQDVETEDLSPPPRRGYLFDVMLDMGVPHYVYNPANAGAFEAIGNISASFHTRVWKNLSIGPMLRFTGFNIWNPRFNQSNPLALTFMATADIRYEVRLSDRFSYIPAINAGVGFIYYNNLLLPKKGEFHTPPKTLTDWGAIVNINNGFYYFVKPNKQMGIGLILGATYFSHEFSKKDTGLQSDETLYNKSDEGPSINLTIGFGLITKFGRAE